jgi:hypothetical protein
MDLEAEETAPDWWPYAPEFPCWHVWRGVTGLLYARNTRSSPAQVVRADKVARLREEITRGPLWRRS